MKQTEKIWTRNFTLATLSGMFAALVLYTMLTTLAGYAQQRYGVGASAAGLMASIFVVGSVVGRIVCGRYLDIIGRRRVVLVCGALFFATSLVYLTDVGFAALLATRTVHGFFFGIIHTAMSTVVIEFIPKARRGEGIGYFSLNFVIATAMGPFIGMTMTRNGSFTMMFVLCAVFALASLLLAFPIQYGPCAADRKAAPPREIFEKRAMPLALTNFLMSLCYTGVTAFLASYARTLGLESAASLFFIVYAACILVVRPAAGRLLDRRGDNIVMVPSSLFFAASLLLLGFSTSAAPLLFCGVLMAFGYGNLLNIGQAIAVKSSPHDRVSMATGTYFLFSDAGWGIGPIVFGLVADAWGFSRMYFVEVGIVAAGLAVYLALHGVRVSRGASYTSKA